MVKPSPPDCPIPEATGFCSPEGIGSIGVLILGEALGEAEANDSLPFRPYAQAGSLLDRAIRRCGFSRGQFVIWNTVPVRPPNNYLEGAPYEAAAVAWGIPQVKEVIHIFKPRCILALGNIAMRASTGLCGDYRGVGYLRGYVLPGQLEGVPVVPSFHPAFLRRGQMPLFSVLMHDLKLAVAVAHCLPTQFFSPVLYRDYLYNQFVPYDVANPIVPAGYVTHPSEGDAWEFLRQARDNPRQLVAYDIETPRSTSATEDDSDELGDTDILSIQLSLAVGSGIFLPWRDPYREIAKLVLALPNPKGGANTWRFDDPLLRAHGCQLNGELHDVRWAWHHLQPDLKAGLQFIASFYPAEGLPHVPWKHLHASHPEYYGIMDVDVLQRIFL